MPFVQPIAKSIVAAISRENVEPKNALEIFKSDVIYKFKLEKFPKESPITREIFKAISDGNNFQIILIKFQTNCQQNF